MNAFQPQKKASKKTSKLKNLPVHESLKSKNQDEDNPFVPVDIEGDDSTASTEVLYCMESLASVAFTLRAMEKNVNDLAEQLSSLWKKLFVDLEETHGAELPMQDMAQLMGQAEILEVCYKAFIEKAQDTFGPWYGYFQQHLPQE